MDSPFRRLAERFLPEGVSLSKGTACSEGKKSLAVDRSSSDDEIIRFDLKKWRIWPHGVKNCDCLILCKKEEQSRFIALLVELKGDDTKSAYDQIEQTAAILCKESGFTRAGHGIAGAANSASALPAGHGGKLLAIIVAPGEGNARGMWQQKAAYLKTRKVLLLPIRRPGVPISIDDLYQEAYA